MRLFTIQKPGEQHPSFGAVGESRQVALAATGHDPSLTFFQVRQEAQAPTGVGVAEVEMEPAGTIPVLNDTVHCRFTFRRRVVRQLSPKFSL